VTIELTDFERRTLEILREHGPIRNTSQVGFLLLETTSGGERKANPSPQGVALFAGRFLGPLQRRGLAWGCKGWSITEKGRRALLEMEVADTPATNTKDKP
jgi:hypothetical protein